MRNTTILVFYLFERRETVLERRLERICRMSRPKCEKMTVYVYIG